MTSTSPSTSSADPSTSSGSGLRSRIVRSFGATALGPVVTAAIQLGTVPLLLHAWGATKYGDWLLLSAVPNYLTLSNLGFGDASGSDMTGRVASGDRDGALRTFHSSLALLLCVSLFVIALTALCVWLIPWQSWLHLSGVSNHTAATVMLALVVYIVVSQQNGILESGFRCDGNYALGTLLGNIQRLTETVLAAAVGVWTGNLLFVAITYLVARAIGAVCYGLVLRSKSPWLTISVRGAHWQTIKQLAAPAFGFIALPLGYAISLQGFTIAVGALLGPLAVTGFSTLRTLTRMTSQSLNVVGFTIWPELSTAFGAGNLTLARSLHRRSYQLGLALSLFSGIALWITGPFIYRLWIRHAVPFDVTSFHILIAVTFVYSLWFISSVVPMSTNAHQRIATAFVIFSAGALALARFVLIPMWGVPGAAWSLLLVDLAMTWLVLRTSLRQLGDSFFAFVIAVLTPPQFWRSPVRTGKGLGVSGS